MPKYFYVASWIFCWQIILRSSLKPSFVVIDVACSHQVTVIYTLGEGVLLALLMLTFLSFHLHLWGARRLPLDGITAYCCQVNAFLFLSLFVVLHNPSPRSCAKTSMMMWYLEQVMRRSIYAWWQLPWAGFFVILRLKWVQWSTFQVVHLFDLH